MAVKREKIPFPFVILSIIIFHFFAYPLNGPLIKIPTLLIGIKSKMFDLLPIIGLFHRERSGSKISYEILFL